ncbi:Beta-1,3-N-acetylglucosaminyltransferase manic fringe [Geodia barretti]|uniref:Beta-1,3-N-acetylglucosaminyltransferase manic fringe n=1 Tax=Geodia barretti TaxID=519541 RepID=A0AA35QS53_GEOBA|nr:Beta-1,3-N-acetylglucosaminyltransferase manic fringe [Geodia barretti]
MHNYSLSRTERINTHGLPLESTVESPSLSHQVAISYGYGAAKWRKPTYNAVNVPHPLYTLEEDESQFRSLHCLLYPATSWCGYRRRLLQSLKISV